MSDGAQEVVQMWRGDEGVGQGGFDGAHQEQEAVVGDKAVSEDRRKSTNEGSKPVTLKLHPLFQSRGTNTLGNRDGDKVRRQLETLRGHHLLGLREVQEDLVVATPAPFTPVTATGASASASTVAR